ncbi:outer surface protein [Spiroplasma sabaudiense Ar-1343]|uniref:Outer surface protein n=1 Tax=Spiroplasma sabaudiense Ar-1343 TaxID=1276257 RepID=W6AA03_9MOLU|nr:MupG family TIM beta-alpha barrel fold protein [Spiroplasma sabaudiense]AHI53816.1 outer surface protein [Spiroplasma sabaudiense Ar-1343]
MREIGISIYPEQSSFKNNLDYLKKSANLGFKILFLSVLQFDENNFLKYQENYFQLIEEAKKLGFYIILDVADGAFKLFKCDINNLEPFAKLGVNCLRLDAPLLPSQVALATYNEFKIDIQINMSNNDSFINNILDFKPIKNKLSGSHNFYPLEDSGLPLAFFIDSSKRYKKFNLTTMAFVGSKNDNQGPVPEAQKLVTLENHRKLEIEIQAKHLFATNLIDWVIIGNAFASDEELIALSQLQREYISFKIDLPKNQLFEIENKILFDNLHFRRGDISEFVIRSTSVRPKYKDFKIQPTRLKKVFQRGDVVILNDNANHYKGELQIILKDNYLDKDQKFNFIENLADQVAILDYIEPWTKFIFY